MANFITQTMRSKNRGSSNPKALPPLSDLRTDYLLAKLSYITDGQDGRQVRADN